jgi:hypothetical protein
VPEFYLIARKDYVSNCPINITLLDRYILLGKMSLGTYEVETLNLT